MTRVAVVDHGAGNLVSIARGLSAAGAEVVIAAQPQDLTGAAGVVLPGVGSSGGVMAGIRRAGFDRALPEWRGQLLGICVGLQVMFDVSAEDGAACLGLIPGSVEPLRSAPRLPHTGWNDLHIRRPDSLFAGLPDRPTFYFVHGFAPVPADPEVITAAADYGSTFCAAVRVGLRAGVQFHPERSGLNGLKLLANFVAQCREAVDAA